MNKKIILCLAIMSVAQASHAQSSVTLYGVIDAAVRYSSNKATDNGPKDQLSLNEGAFSGGRWGIRGIEDLGSRNRAIFALESGFSYDTGKSAQQGQLFGRQAWIGLSNETLGTLKTGRQNGAAYSFLAKVDPLNIANYTELAWQDILTGIRYDNTIDYSKNFGPVFVNAQYSFGERAGSTAIGRTIQFATTYETDALLFGAAGTKSTDANGKDATTWTTGLRYSFGDVSLHGYYVDSRRDPGFVVGLNGSTDPLANTSQINNANTVAGANTQNSVRHDRAGVLGLNYQVTPAWRLVAAYVRDNVAGASRGSSGLIQTAYFVAMYSLSKRTEVYIEADRSWLAGASVNDPNSPIGTFGGASTRTGAAVGLRTRF
ncbi:porin (plasmid) [Cupriavidus pinatubonensis]|uniref:porin n=1 Tax=Cupriavidus pinatubonensis TaxID=248026 RepID=UPI001C7365DC|nr:porin [Cupriavidus pinatubonensis]QYY33885.1 porin [Cupriavidus pinatubonensis]